MADLDPWASDPVPLRPAAPSRPRGGGAWERLENLDRPSPAMAPEPLGVRRSGIGALWAVGLPVLALAAAWLFLRAVPCSGKACVVPGAAGWGAGLLAVPTAPLVGVPWQSGPLTVSLAAASSVAVWLGIGWWSLRRSDDGGSATGQVLWLGAAVWLGALVGLLVGTLALSS
jgi:hypothetical protein